jgi:cobalt-zinc-cadmium efflux system protein
MGHNHSHNHSHNHFDEGRAGNKRGLMIALTITTSVMVLEFFGGLITNSLALLSDAGHMLSDAASLFLSLVAMWFATRPPSPEKSYGFYRFEILAALFNGITLFIIAGFIVWEAFGRFFAPPTVASGSMIIIAFIGLLANIVSAWFLIQKSDVKNNVNMRSAYLHVLGDALGSVGAILAGIVMLFFGWYVADPVISVVVALLILKSAWGVIWQSVHILLEGTPPSVNYDEVKAMLMQIEGVVNVHDLHIWTVTSGLEMLSGHILIEDEKSSQDMLQQAIHIMKENFHLDHVTIQIEKSATNHAELKV